MLSVKIERMVALAGGQIASKDLVFSACDFSVGCR